ncbi:MAG: hypothetical protein KKB81_00540 [Candidatus Margulisbacteria bacterium]|nr:hypothetical protein [Candidatus Margulisiibacteriota bacterium]MBU1022311.1 hypothetical protein [Candidatus Margulisiibacteriota bacterium]MBU1729924.1 hypothetical protein [Candidatus Margulisiibacteriota bacterium]MBU1955957.1 hypothetical protein [Candidatus Margulisiibacteriota bacterium]
MIKHIAQILIICMALLPFTYEVSAKTVEWEKEVSITDETVIVEKNEVRVKPGTQVKFTGGKSKLEVKGRLLVSGSEDNPAVIIIPNLLNGTTPTPIRQLTVLKLNNNIKELEIYPYDVETDKVIEELQAFRWQYAFVWTVLMGVCFYLVLNKSTYW